MMDLYLSEHILYYSVLYGTVLVETNRNCLMVEDTATYGVSHSSMSYAHYYRMVQFERNSKY